MKKMLIIVLFLLFASMLSVFQPIPAAQASNLWQSQEGIETIGADAFGVNDPTSKGNKIQVVIARVIKAFLGVLGIVFVVLLVWAGYKYMISQGNEDKITEAIGQIRTAIIGLIIILISWSIASYVTDCILDITQGGMMWMCQ